MLCTNPQSKSGLSLVEVMISMAIFGLLGGAVWMNVAMQGQNFLYNRISNSNVQDASFLVNRLVYGNDQFWGLRLASRQFTSVGLTGQSGTNGAQGWRADVRHNVDDDDAPALLDTELQTYVYDPVARTLSINGTVVGRNVVDSYCTLDGGNLLLGVQVEDDIGGVQTILETRIRMRNL